MGNNTSNTIDVANNVFSSQVANILQRNTNNIVTNVTADQKASFVVKNSDVNCTDSIPLISQSMTGSVVIASNISQSTTADIKTLIQSTLSSSSEQSQKAVNELFGGIGINTQQSTNLQNAVQTVIENNVTQDTLNNAVNQVSFNQDGNIVIESSTYTGPCATDQNMVLNIQAQNVIGSIVSTVMENTQVTDIINEVKQAQDVENKGLSDVIKSVGESIAKVIDAAGKIITSPGIIALGIIAVVLFFLSVGVPAVSGFTYTDENNQKRTKSWVIVLMVFFIVTLTACIVTIIVLYNQGKNRKYPDDVVTKKCETQYDEVKPVYEKWAKESNEDAKNKILQQNKTKIDAYSTCMA